MVWRRKLPQTTSLYASNEYNVCTMLINLVFAHNACDYCLRIRILQNMWTPNVIWKTLWRRNGWTYIPYATMSSLEEVKKELACESLFVHSLPHLFSLSCLDDHLIELKSYSTLGICIFPDSYHDERITTRGRDNGRSKVRNATIVSTKFPSRLKANELGQHEPFQVPQSFHNPTSAHITGQTGCYLQAVRLSFWYFYIWKFFQTQLT